VVADFFQPPSPKKSVAGSPLITIAAALLLTGQRHDEQAPFGDCENRNRATRRNVALETASPLGALHDTRLLGPGWLPLARPFHIGRAGKKMELLIGVAVGFVLGYGVRSLMSRYRSARARRQTGYTGL
jgi:hypothetical protein